MVPSLSMIDWRVNPVDDARLNQLKASLEQVLLPTVKWNRQTKKHDDVKIPCASFIRDGLLIVGNDDGEYFLDYYGEFFPKEAPYIHPMIEQWAKDNNCYWEWRDPGSIVLYET
jgi:hypothetical protein